MVERDFGKCKLQSVGVQVRWVKGEQAEYTFRNGEGNEEHQSGTGEQSVSDRNTYIIPRCRGCNVIVLNVHALREDRSDDVKNRIYKQLRHVPDHFPRYNMKIWLDDFKAKVGSEDIFKPKKME